MKERIIISILSCVYALVFRLDSPAAREEALSSPVSRVGNGEASAMVRVKMDDIMQVRPVSLFGGNIEDLNYQLKGPPLRPVVKQIANHPKVKHKAGFVNAESGLWSIEGNVIRQNDAQSIGIRLSFGDHGWGNIEYSLQARKLRGKEGFLIPVGINRQGECLWINLGGWQNTRHGIEDLRGKKRPVGRKKPGSIQPGRWYDIRIRTEGKRIRVWLDGEELFNETVDGEPITGQVGLGTWNTAAEFRNLKVKNHAGQVLFEGLPQITGARKRAVKSGMRGSITVHVDQPVVSLKKELYGVFFEDINYAADGGLYAELIQNRSFEYYPVDHWVKKNWQPRKFTPLTAWETVEYGGGSCKLTVESDTPLNPNNPHYARLQIRNGGTGVGISNSGYNGIYVEKGKRYVFSVFVKRSTDLEKPLHIFLRTQNGSVIGEAVIPGTSRDWKKYAATLTASTTAEKASLEVVTVGAGTLCLDMVSLFPQDTFKGRENGLRKDLVQALVDLKPKVFRFPGGCIVHGQGLDNAYRWKDTVGPVEARKNNWNLWGYHQSHGLGYFEYFQLCEDIGAEPLPVLPVGVSCGFRDPKEFAALDKLQPWIDDVIDLVEFANGPVDSRWGHVRAEMGHPEPFHLKYIALGNEEHDTPEFRERFPYFVKALRQSHPEILIVGTSGLSPNIPLYEFMCEQKVDLSDEHYYKPPLWFINNQHRFDKWNRSKVPVFVGEYASRGNTMFNAAAEAVYLTGIERNGDIVHMTAYAPLFARYGFTQWKQANLIWFDHKTVVKTPNYYVQQLFSVNKGDVYLKNEINDLPEKVGISATRDEASGDVILKIANPSAQAYTASVKLEGISNVAPIGTLTMLRGPAHAVNSLEKPDAIKPVARKTKVGKTFECAIPPMSVQVIRLRVMDRSRLMFSGTERKGER